MNTGVYRCSHFCRDIQAEELPLRTALSHYSAQKRKKYAVAALKHGKHNNNLGDERLGPSGFSRQLDSVMWRRVYLLLLLVRVYFALSPSYLHPDENFQGPEVIAGQLFPYPSHQTWEWTSSNPVRSLFPLWPVYGLPMTLLTWIWAEDAQGTVSPEAIYYALRMVMFMLSFVLEDWAIYELVQSPVHRSEAVALVASSYVTWTFQSHTFSNSIETLLVAWSLVLIDRIISQRTRSSLGSCAVLGFVVVFGIFNRITFPAFIMIPGLRLLQHFRMRPFTCITIALSGLIFTFIAIATDTAFYIGPSATTSLRALFAHMYNSPIITPLNSLRYNTQSSNLALHGLHPHYQHIFLNIPQLLGPALIPLLLSLYPFTYAKLDFILKNPRLTSALTGSLILSLIPHQEPRFLLPAIPLLLTCIRIPKSSYWAPRFWASWIAFNAAMGVLMGIYHQGGIVPAQIAIPDIIKQTSNETTADVYWWKTYPPPTYLLGSPTTLDGKALNITTIPLMGTPESEVRTTLCQPSRSSAAIFLVSPLSAHFFDGSNKTSDGTKVAVRAEKCWAILRWSFSRHINLDDIGIADDGVFGTMGSIVGRRGIGVWQVEQDREPQAWFQAVKTVSEGKF